MKYSKEKAHERKSRRSFLEKSQNTRIEITADSSEELLKEYHTYKDELE